MSDNVIEISSIVKEYKMFARKKDRLMETMFPFIQKHGTFRAIDNLSLEVKKGEVLGILGKNGAGKSTLLKMITGVVIPTSGTIKVNGKISSLLELGTAFNMELTGIENIYQHGQVMGLTNEQIDAKRDEIIEFADIGDHIYQPVKTYSSGMFARLAFACAINVDPDVLIVDEVLSVGDMSFQLKCFKKFEQFKNSGKTILFVTHGIGDVLRNCTRTVIIDAGKKIFDGGVKEGVEKYKKIIVGLGNDEKSVDEKIDIEKSNIETEKLANTDEIKTENDKNKSEKKTKKGKKSEKNTWKENFTQNENLVEYGNKKAEVIDYGIFDVDGKYLQTIENDKEVVLKSKIKFNEDVSDPIFTMTVKDFKGLEMCGTNTVIEKQITGKVKKGEIRICEFKQIIPLAPSKYTLSFSCTKYNEKGELEVLNRKYDALLVEIISTKECVGLIKIDSDIVIKKVEE